MARYKDYSYEQTKLIPLSFDHQILPGTFEYTLNYLIDNEVDLSLFDSAITTMTRVHRPMIPQYF